MATIRKENGKRIRVYISGKISGLNIEDVTTKFNDAEEFLTLLGFEVVNPLNNGIHRDEPWITHMCKDLEMLHGCDAVFFLNDWQESKGACVEYDFALRMGKNIIFESGFRKPEEFIMRLENALYHSTGMRPEEYKSKSREQHKFFARIIYSYECQKRGISSTEIAKKLNRDHSAITYFIKKYEDESNYNPQFRVIADKTKQMMQGYERH